MVYSHTKKIGILKHDLKVVREVHLFARYYLKIILALGGSLLFCFVLYFVMQELTEDSLAAWASLVWCGLGVLSSLPPAACLYDSQTHLQHALWLSWFCFLHTLPPIYTCICITLLTLFSVTAVKKFLFAPVCMHQLFWEMQPQS